jgi:NAD+ kinase
MGDVVELSTSKASELNLFTSSWFRRNHAEMWPSRLPPSRLAQEMAVSEDGDWIIE